MLVLTAAIYLEGAPFLELRSGPMTSALGTFRTSRDVRLESAMRAKADIGPGDREARR